MVNTQQLFEEDERKRPGEYGNDSPDQNPLAHTKPEDVVSGAEDILRQENEARNGDQQTKRNGDAVSRAGLAAGEGIAGAAAGGEIASQLGNGFVAGVTPMGKIATLKKIFWGSTNRKRLSVGGGITGIAVTGGVLALSYGSGPFEFIHIAQLLEKFHFASQQDESDDRFTSLIRDANYRIKGEPYKTNMNYVGNKLADSFEAKLNAQGLTSSYGKYLGSKLGYIVDTENENWQIDGKPMTPEQIQAKIKEQSGIDVNVSTVDLEGGDTGIFIEQPSGYFDAKGIVKYVLNNAGEKSIVSAVGARVLAQRDGLTLHPLKRLDSNLATSLDKKIAAYKKARDQANTEGSEAPISGTSEDPADDKDGKPDPMATANAGDTSTEANNDLTASQAAATSEENGDPGPISKLTEKFSSTLDNPVGKTVGGAAVVIGAACLLRGLAQDAGSLKEAQVVLPLARMGMRSISEGNQIMADSSDVDVAQLDADSQQLYDTTSKTSWSQSNSIESELGEPLTNTGGKSADGSINNGAADGTLATIGSGSPFDFLSQGPLDSALSPVCSGAGQVVTTAISFLGGPFSAAASLIVGYIASQTILPTIFSDAAHWLAGSAVDVDASGANFGNDIDYGARLAANDQAVSAGGRQLSSSEELALDNSNTADAQAQFSHESLAYKIFSPDSSQSIVGTIMDHQSTQFATNLENATLAVMNVGHTLADLPSMLFSGIVKAAPAQPYNYGFDAIGFSAAEMSNPAVSNPYANGDAVADILNAGGSTASNYETKVTNCFGDTLMQSSVTEANGSTDQVWDVEYGTSTVNVFTTPYTTSDCNDSSLTWLQFRFFVFDTQNLKAAACYQGDAQSCTDLSFTDPSDSSGGSD